MKRGGSFKNIGLLLASFALALACAEIALRISGRFSPHEIHTISDADYDRLPGMWEPNQDLLVERIPELTHHIRINSLGMRGAEPTKDSNRIKILFVGDSFTFGDYVNDEDTLPAQTEQQLGVRYETFNGGVGGTGIIDQEVFLKRLLRIQPRMVVLVFSENDLSDLLAVPAMHESLAANRRLKSGVFGPLYHVLRDSSVFHLLLQAKAMYWLNRNPRYHGHVGLIGKGGENQARQAYNPELEQRYVHEVEIMKQTLDQAGIPFVVAAFPSHYTVFGDPALGAIPGVLGGLEAAHISHLDLTAALRKSELSKEELYLFPYDGHPSAKAYALAAVPIAAEIQQRNLAAP